METSRLLLQQVDEQSDLCDVTIKVGSWTKRFHWCVLIASPFFDAVYRSRSFVKKTTGTIKIDCIASFKEVEEAIMFLYNKTPYITEANVAGLFNMAEFLLIPTLKRLCAYWIERVQMSKKNCFTMLHLANMYEVHVPYLESYIKENMITVLEDELSITLAKETIELLLQDISLSYVGVNTWFPFLVRWTKARSDRELQFSGLFRMLDLSYMNPSLKQMLLNEELIERNNLHGYVIEKFNAMEDTTKVVLLSKSVCLKVNNGKLYTISSEELSDFCKSSISPNETKPFLSRLSKIIEFTEVTCWNISANTKFETKVVYDDGSAVCAPENLICFRGSLCYVLATKIVISRNHIGHNHRVIDWSYLYKADLDNDCNKAILKHVICLKNRRFTAIAVDKEHNIAFLSMADSYLLVYDQVQCRLQKIDLDGQDVSFYEAQLMARTCGFVVTIGSTIKIISAVHGTSVKKSYTVTSLMYPEYCKGFGWQGFQVCDDIFFVNISKYFAGFHTYICKYVHIDNLAKAIREDAEWTEVQKHDSFGTAVLFSVFSSASSLNIPVRMLMCNIECPHCSLPYSRLFPTCYI